MDILTILFDALLLAVLVQVLLALLRIVYRHELSLARRAHRRQLIGIPIETRTPDLHQQALHRARRGGHSRGA
jgi:hypothetical protein